MPRVNLLNHRQAGRAFTTNFVITAPDYLARKGLFRSRLRVKVQAVLTTYLGQLQTIVRSNYGKWLKPAETISKVYSRQAQRQEVGRFTVTNPLFTFVEWNTRPHFPPLLRAEGPVFNPRKARHAPRAKRTSATLTDARILGTNMTSRTRSPRKPIEPRRYIANSGITRWTAEHGGGVPYLVARKISISGTIGKLIVTNTIKRIAAILQREFAAAVLGVFDGN